MKKHYVEYLVTPSFSFNLIICWYTVVLFCMLAVVFLLLTLLDRNTTVAVWSRTAPGDRLLVLGTLGLALSSSLPALFLQYAFGGG